MDLTFFDHLSIANVERIHSEIIRWIFELDDKIISNNIKAKIIKNMFEISNNIKLENFESYSEYKNIDILIKTDNAIFVIENKLKSSEHTGQTNKYYDIINKEFDISNKEIYYGFLSLIGEKPLNDNWKIITFEDLKNTLSKLDLNYSIKDHLFISEYIITLNNLITAFNEFINNPQNYENVFIDGSKKKYEKKAIYDDPIKKYIGENQLETIFQKAFLRDMANKVSEGDFKIEETHGNALIQWQLDQIEFKRKKFNIGLQLQRNTIKVNLSRADYYKSKAKEIDEVLQNAFTKIFLNINDYKKLNLPKTKAYISVSKNLKQKIWKFKKDILIKLLNSEIKKTKIRIHELNTELNI